MNLKKTALERAFEIAASGECPNVVSIRKKLNREGYSAIQIRGPVLYAQLRAKIKEAVDADPEDDNPPPK